MNDRQRRVLWIGLIVLAPLAFLAATGESVLDQYRPCVVGLGMGDNPAMFWRIVRTVRLE